MNAGGLISVTRAKPIAIAQTLRTIPAGGQTTPTTEEEDRMAEAQFKAAQ